VDFAKQSVSKQLETLGKMKLYLDDKLVGEDDLRIQSGHYSIAGEGLCVGYDGGDAVSSEYKIKI